MNDSGPRLRAVFIGVSDEGLYFESCSLPKLRDFLALNSHPGHQSLLSINECIDVRFQRSRCQGSGRTGIHDYNTKKGHVERFLNQRAKVKVTIMFRGRETTHPERGRDLLTVGV